MARKLRRSCQKKFYTFKFPRLPRKSAITVTLGNEKIGDTLNTSFPPVKTCPVGIACAKDCYAVKYMKRRPNILKAYNKNLRIFKNNPTKYWAQIKQAIETVKPRFFRYMVSGDIPTLSYLQRMISTADNFPATKFLVFTKQYDFLLDFTVIKNFPSNLQIIASAWPEVPLPEDIRKNYRVAWVDNGHEFRIPKNAVVCKDYCPSCRVCFLPSATDIVFPYH